MKGSTAMWNYDAVDKKEAERMASLYGEDATRTVEHGTEAETGELLVRSCGNELGFATWEAFDFERNTWLCEAFENREAAELWLSGEEVDTCFELDDQLVLSTKRMAALAANMSGGRWTAELKGEDLPVLLGALAVATEQNQRALGRLLADMKFENMPELPEAINPMEAAFAEAKGKLLEWKESGHGDARYHYKLASSYLDEYHSLDKGFGRCLVESIDELIEYGYVDESGVYENPIAAIGTMLAEAALEHARADAEYFDEDFRMRATEGINLWTVAKEIIEAVPAAKPAEEEPAQARGPKH